MPDGLKLRVGLSEVRRSLKTDSIRQAEQLAAQHVARLKDLFDLARHSELSNAEIQALAQNYYDKLAPDAELFRPRTSEPQHERREQADLAQAEIRELERQSESAIYDRSVMRAVEDAIRPQGISLRDLSDSERTKVTHGVARAMIEHLHLFLHRLDEPLLPYEPTDPLIGDREARASQDLPVIAPIDHAELRPSFGPTISTLVKVYLDAKAASWVPKTHANRSRKLMLFVEHLGPNKRISEVTPDDMRDFCRGLSRMRRSHHTGCDRTFQGRQTDDEGARVDPKTVALHADDVKSMFLWAQKHGYCKEPPLAGLVVDLPKKPKGKKARAPFGAPETRTLFSTPTFTGCKGPRRRFEAGPLIMRDAYFWIPILGYYTGARLSELVQLHLGDVGVDEPIPFIDINENNVPGAPDNQKHVKSQAGVRKVPLHADLIELGFLKFVADRLNDKRAKASRRLFFEVPYGADGQPSTVFGGGPGRPPPSRSRCPSTSPWRPRSPAAGLRSSGW